MSVQFWSITDAGSQPARAWSALQRLYWAWPLFVALTVLYLPTFAGLAAGLWSTESHAHGPVILALSTWLFLRNRSAMLQAAAGSAPAPAAGWALCGIGLALYFVGRSMGMPIAELASFVSVWIALVLIFFGKAALRVQWFPFFFLLFMMPIPGELLSMLTLPMKTAVSWVVDEMLFRAGYPIARTGVVLQIGQYQLLVADACAGLQTLLTLEALGLFYLNVVRHASALRNGLLAALIIPISFAANVIRVTALVLVTYYFGSEAGQGFLHGFAGFVLFFIALILIIVIDGALRTVIASRQRAHGSGTALPGAMP